VQSIAHIEYLASHVVIPGMFYHPAESAYGSQFQSDPAVSSVVPFWILNCTHCPHSDRIWGITGETIFFMHSVPIMDDPAREGVPRRSSSRRRIDTLVYADFGPGNGGFPINLSKDGMAFQGIQPLEKGRIICVKFKLPATTEIVEISGQVVWLNELGKGGGLQFTDVTEESRQAIEKWLSSEAKQENHEDDSPVRARPPEQKPQRPAATIELVAREGKTAGKAAVTAPRSVLSSITAVEVNAGAKLGGSAPRAAAERAKLRGSETERSWIVPFAIGMAASAAVMVAILSYYGVISIQFRWPQKLTSETAASPSIAPNAAKVSASMALPATGKGTDRLESGSAAASAPPATSNQEPMAAPAVPAAKSSQPIPTKAEAPAKIRSPQMPLEKLMTAKPIVPSPVKTAAPADVQPPAFALSAKSDPAAQLSLISPKTAAPAPPAPTRQTGKYEAPQLISHREPVFPPVARQTGVSGSVELQFTITPDGKVRDVSVVNGNPMLARAAIDAVQTWRYAPARLGGVAVEAQSNTIINFKSN
jgi:protein TonB